ncbi:MAG: response regulator [Acidobacteriota bacterium]
MNERHDRIRLLLVDDEEEFLVSSARALGRRGFEVDVAPNGVTALEKLNQQVYEVVLLDVKMPDLDGVEVFRLIRHKFPALPVVLLTGHSSLEDAFQTSKDGVADYLSKPIDMDDLAERLNRAVRKGWDTDEQEGDDADVAGPVNVMIVDDETEFLDSVKTVLARRNMDVATAESGETALALLKERLVDVMILDVKMPGMDGLDVLRRVKREFPSVQVVLLSGHPSAETAVEGIKQGASEYLQKPPEMDALARTIRRLFRERQEAVLEKQQRLIEEIRRRFPE